MAEQLENVLTFLLIEEPLEDVSACPRTAELLGNVHDFPLTSEPLEKVLACPLEEKPPENGLVCLQTAESWEIVLVSPLKEEPMKNVLACPLTLSVDPFLGLGHFSLRSLSFVLPTWSRTKWWTSFSAHSSHLLSCIPILITSSIMGTFLARGRYVWYLSGTKNILPSWGGTRVPLCLVGDVEAYLSSSGVAFPTIAG